MANWQIQFKNSAGSSSSWWTIPAPTNEITITTTSTRKQHTLYTGGTARTIPTTKMNYEPVTLEWGFISASNVLLSASTGTLSLKQLMSGGWAVNIKTHALVNSTTEVWSGYIQSYPRIYKLGMFKGNATGYETFYDLSIIFDLISVT